MHELGLTQEVIEIACRKCEGARVRRVVLEVGLLTAVLPDAMLFCFDLCAEGTPLEGAKLDIRQVPGKARCRKCSKDLTLEQPFGNCPCGSLDLEWLSGQELRIVELEVV